MFSNRLDFINSTTGSCKFTVKFLHLYFSIVETSDVRVTVYVD